MNSCDVCGSTENVKAGRWVFYCPAHKQKDWQMTFENELRSGEDIPEYASADGELQEMILESL